MGLLITRYFFLKDFAHVVCPAQSLQAALLIEQGVDFPERHSQMICQEKGQRRIDITRARPHDQPRQWCHAHGSINTFSLLNGSHAGSVSQVDGYEVYPIERPA